MNTNYMIDDNNEIDDTNDCKNKNRNNDYNNKIIITVRMKSWS